MKTLKQLQERWAVLDEKARELRWSLEGKYGSPWYINVPRAQRERIEKAHNRADKAQEAIFAWLDTHSPRSWRSGVPANWVATQLTEEDALTRGRLSVTPPVAYGGMPSDSLRFAAAIA
jgi:hypothetical protein